MKASTWVKTLPDGKTAQSLADRERMIVQAVADGFYVLDWHSLEIHEFGRRVMLAVSRDTLRIGEPGDSVRVSLSARAQEQAAELLGARLLTPKLVDIIYREAEVKCESLTRAWWKDNSMAFTARMLEQSAALDARIGNYHNKLVANAGKDWVLIRSMPKGKAANYGWLGTGAERSVFTKVPIIQSVGTAHGPSHVDYSQLPRFVSQQAVLDNDRIDLEDLLLDPEASKVIAHDGPISLGDAPDTEPAPPPRRSSSSMNAAVMIGDEPGVPYIKARNFTQANRSKVDLVVIHSMEAPEKPGTALAVAKWFASASAPRASAHWCVDGGEVDALIQCVLEKHVAWHAPGANANGIGIEHAGYAKQTEAQWLDDYSMNMLQRSAELAARICKRHDIPLVRLSKEMLVAGQRGFCGHVDVSLAFRKSTHTDPGSGFPWNRYLAMVAAEKAKLV